MTTVTIIDESLSSQKLSWSLDLLDETLSLRDLIRQRVYQEVTEYNARQSGPFQGLVQPTDAERTLNGSHRTRRRLLDWQAHYEKAIEVFSQHGYLVVIDDTQVTDLETLLELHTTTRVTFLKLVPLIGG